MWVNKLETFYNTTWTWAFAGVMATINESIRFGYKEQRDFGKQKAQVL